jgi:hypothetical protein
MTFNAVALGSDGFSCEYTNSNGKITVSNIDRHIRYGKAFTIEVDFSISTAGQRHQGILSNLDGSTTNPHWSIYHKYDSAQIRFLVYDGSTYAITGLSCSDTQINKKMTIVSDGYNVHMYLDGVFVSSGTFLSTYNVGERVITLCKWSSVGLDGFVKSCSIYNRALTAAEVLDRYNQSTFLVE